MMDPLILKISEYGRAIVCLNHAKTGRLLIIYLFSVFLKVMLCVTTAFTI